MVIPSEHYGRLYDGAMVARCYSAGSLRARSKARIHHRNSLMATPVSRACNSGKARGQGECAPRLHRTYGHWEQNLRRRAFLTGVCRRGKGQVEACLYIEDTTAQLSRSWTATIHSSVSWAIMTLRKWNETAMGDHESDLMVCGLA